MPKVEVVPDDRVDPQRLGASPYDLVVIETTDGRRLESARVTPGARLAASCRCRAEELWAKFEACFAVGNPKLDARAIFDALMSLERQPGVAAFASLRKAA